MFISHNREKLLNAIVYFVENTKYCNTIKLFKLLNFLDFEHFRQTGRSVTGLHYQAWREGPVPKELWKEIHHPNKDMTDMVSVAVVRDELSDEPKRRDFTPRKKFDPAYFTKRELQIMERLVFFFAETTASDMSRYSHSPKMPWKKVYKGEGAAPADIPYGLALESDAIIRDMESIDPQELTYRESAFAEIDKHNKQ